MFDKIKQMKQIMDLQNQMKQEKAEAEKDGVRVVVNGKLEVEAIYLNPNLTPQQQEKSARDCVNDALRKVQMSAAQKMMNLPGFWLQ